MQKDRKTREPLSKADSRTGLIAFHIQPPLATLASLTHFILHTSEQCNSNKNSRKDLAYFDLILGHGNHKFLNQYD